MIPGIGAGELLILAVAALLIFGPGKLPEIMGQAGKAIRDFRNMTGNLSGDFEKSLNEAAGTNVRKTLDDELRGIKNQVEGVGKGLERDLNKSAAGVNRAAGLTGKNTSSTRAGNRSSTSSAGKSTTSRASTSASKSGTSTAARSTSTTSTGANRGAASTTSSRATTSATGGSRTTGTAAKAAKPVDVAAPVASKTDPLADVSFFDDDSLRVKPDRNGHQPSARNGAGVSSTSRTRAAPQPDVDAGEVAAPMVSSLPGAPVALSASGDSPLERARARRAAAALRS